MMYISLETLMIVGSLIVIFGPTVVMYLVDKLGR